MNDGLVGGGGGNPLIVSAKNHSRSYMNHKTALHFSYASLDPLELRMQSSIQIALLVLRCCQHVVRRLQSIQAKVLDSQRVGKTLHPMNAGPIIN